MEIIRDKNIEEELGKARQEIKELERYIEDFLGFLPLPFCMVNILNIIIDINDRFSDLTGYKESEIVGKEMDILFLDKKEASVLREKILEEKIIKREGAVLVTKNREEITVALSVSLRQDEKGEPIGYFLVITDISELKKLQIELEEKVRKRTEELTKETKELEETRKALINMLEDIEEARVIAEEEKSKAQAIITNFVDGLLVFNKENILIIANPQAENLFRMKAGTILGKSMAELGKLSDFRLLVNLLSKSFEETKNTIEIKDISRKELELKGNLILEVSTFPILRREEKIGTSVILHDVTREKLIEQMKTEFVSLSAHQLRTPLSAIKWTLKMILDGDLGEITKEQRDFLSKTYQSNERMISLINDLLNVARIEEGRYLFNQLPVQFEKLAQSITNSYKDEAKRKKINFKFQKPKEKFPKINLDEEKISLAIQNLIDNAVRYTQPGGQVTVSLKRANMEIEFLVKDSGVGIPKDQKDRVFGKFFRGANAVRLETEGSGLGLFITKNIIEAHGGKIWFESEENRGATFHFTLPI